MRHRPRSSQSIEQLIETQCRKWQVMGKEKDKKKSAFPCITVSREPGSQGRQVAKELAGQLDLDLFGGKIIHEVAKSANMSERVVESLDEKGRSFLNELVEVMERKRHLWDYEYLSHLTKVIRTIGEHGPAVLLGRGANFILPTDKTFRIRVIAPLDVRIKNFADEFGVSEEEAEQHVKNVGSDRKAFIRKYFHADITDPMHYNLVINTKGLSIDAAVKIIKTALEPRMVAR